MEKKENMYYRKYKIAMERLKMIEKLNLPEKRKRELEDKLFNWVEDKEKKEEDCPLKEWWWQ